MTEPSIHIHEDDWGMRNLFPVAALPDAAADVQAAAESGERNRIKDGIGWTAVHVIAAPATDYAAAGLKLVDAATALAPIMPRVRRFTATAMAGFSQHDPMGSYEEGSWCFGFDADCYVKLDPVGDLVKDIWFECRTAAPDRLDALVRALHAIDALAPSAIADYWEDMAGAVADNAFMTRYIERLASE